MSDDGEPIGALVDRPGWDEETLRAEIRLKVPGIPCEVCSVGKLHTPTVETVDTVRAPSGEPAVHHGDVVGWPDLGDAMSVWKNHVKSLTMEVPADLLANPANVRRHPAAQRDALEGSLDELGWVGAVIVNDRTNYLVDGHARVEAAISAGTPVIPVLHIDISEAQERLMLAVYDPISAMARNDSERLDDLLASISTGNESLQALLDSLQGEEIDDAPIHAPKAKETASYVILFEDSVDQSEFVGCLSLVPGNNPADKLLRVLRTAIG